jgi:hypothetical protein
MKALKVRIIKYVDNWNPGWVKCVFKDIRGKEWSIIEKVPVITSENLDSNSQFPIDSFIACEVINQSHDIITIDLNKPWGVSEENGQTVFEVFEDQIIEMNSNRMTN